MFQAIQNSAPPPVTAYNIDYLIQGGGGGAASGAGGAGGLLHDTGYE